MKISDSTKFTSLFRKPEYGSNINWVFNPGLKVSLSAGVLGAVGVVLLIKGRWYLDLSSSDQDNVYPRSWVVPGLQNLGNNCFLNVVLQALASCPSFRKYLRDMVEEYGLLSYEEGDESLPLFKSLTSLVEELCTVRHTTTVLSPRKLMVMMEYYIPNFSLTSQQDAEEAFSLLLSSLREEIAEHCAPNISCLADLPGLQNGRILSKSHEGETEWQKWDRCFLKPFDGIVCSNLVCQSCSFQISLDFQLFHTIHLSPPTSSGSTIMAGCTLEDCLKNFFMAEHVENYCCSNCWHNAAIEYSSVFAEDETVVEKLQNCNKDDSCECKKQYSLEAFPWSNKFSRTLKQMSISRSPKILCIHLQRASYNMFGQSVKLQGHISFPSILDISKFMNTGIGIKSTSKSQFGPLNPSLGEIRLFPFPKYQNTLVSPRKLHSAKSTCFETNASENQEKNTIAVNNGPCLKASESSLLDSERHANTNESTILPLAAPLRHQTYRLVSVVVHFGTSGGGHYTVYRKVTGRLGNEDPVALLESSIEQWFCISDSEVYSVSEKDVLGANASMLFYEKIESS
ncbi:Ubiquitin carboxyl-terminal hydrolase 27 [Striga hermonthica]|uniref:Ubiquitin carboxyl-terminal hydrolase n=1 Tax=Striga hermonthica TaxID=68872 RepID=A0A9N7NZ03_STRHE|nr:Ubiquitin carboxyl-terminal hydrolase 27 [Striga hermonthica]